MESSECCVLSQTLSPCRCWEAAAWQGRMGALPVMNLQVSLLAQRLHCGSVGACGGCKIKTDVKPKLCPAGGPPALHPFAASEPTEHCPLWPRQHRLHALRPCKHWMERTAVSWWHLGLLESQRLPRRQSQARSLGTGWVGHRKTGKCLAWGCWHQQVTNFTQHLQAGWQ